MAVEDTGTGIDPSNQNYTNGRKNLVATIKIFINYRREDEPGFVQALFIRLEQAFEPERLFMDVDNIPPGRDFDERVATPSTCTVQAPQSAIPQPTFVPVMPSASRNTHKSGVSPSTSIVRLRPLTLIVIAIIASGY